MTYCKGRLQHQRIFPTHIFSCDNFYPYHDELLSVINKQYDNDKTYVLKIDGTKEKLNNWQSKPDLHKSENFKQFAEYLIEANKEVIRDKLQYEFDDIRITDMWANHLKPGEYHPPHTHSNNVWSGVWYADAEQTSGICFADPKVQANVIVPSSKSSVDNATVLQYTAKTNRIYLFPSWLYHWVPALQGNKTRTSVSWNIQLIGNVGKSTHFQSAFFE